MLNHLPHALLALLHSFLALALAQVPQDPTGSISSAPTTLSFTPPLWNLTASTLPTPATFALPPASPLVLSLSLCAAAPGTRFFVTNDSARAGTALTPDDVDDTSTFELLLYNGMGSLVIDISDTGYFGVYNASSTLSLQVGLSSTAPLHRFLETPPLLGDTTSNQALLFSPAFAPQPLASPSYPNYTFPPANLTYPQWDDSDPLDSYSLYIASTASFPSAASFASLPLTACALSAAGAYVETPASPSSLGLWQRDPNEGWRWQYLVNGLVPSTNYTMWAVLNGTMVSPPSQFVTKTASFSCPLVHSLPYCPALSYSAPLPPPPNPAVGYGAADLPDTFTQPLISGLANFTAMLGTLACGRDLYSELVTCADCAAAYRRWLCLVSLPRCGEFPPNATATFPSPTVALEGAAQQVVATQHLLPALTVVNASAPPRNPNLEPFTNWYYALQPCVEACTAVDRACPPFLGFRCPVPHFNAASSYGVGYIDSAQPGVVGGGTTGVAQDVWGNVWCGLS